MPLAGATGHRRALCCRLTFALLLLADFQNRSQSNGQEMGPNSEQDVSQQPIRDNSIASSQPDADQLIVSQEQLKQLQSPAVRRNELAKLERRIDWLEFELRRSLHQLQQQQQLRAPTGSNQAPGGADAPPDAGAHRSADSKLIDLSERLNLVEKFITITTTKMYEVEQKLGQLDKCECQISCKWAPNQQPRHGNQIRRDESEGRELSAELNTQSEANRQELDESRLSHQDDRPPDHQRRRSNSTRPQLRRDGQVWRHECDICSCHRGHVSCRPQSCPAPSCDNPQQVRGKCCPVCYKSCTFKGQSVRHGNKLVINSDEQMCKECLCLDGRFKCQRVNLMGGVQWEAPSLRLQRGADNLLAPGAEDQDEGAESALDRAQLIDALELQDNDGEDYDQEDETGSSQEPTKVQRPRRKRKRDSAGSAWPPLFCPPVECPASERFRLENDCCTYCRGHDFCRRPNHFRPGPQGRPELFHDRLSPTRCHPNAECSLTEPAEHNASSANGPPRPLDSMFRCECRRGFAGDGQHSCADVDECLDERLNDCDPDSTRCVNLAGAYECQCRPGFKAAPVRLARNSSAGGAPEPVAVVRAGERRVLQKCVDVNECLDGKLNGCHPDAKCVNLAGSYKCHCKRGFLGNGFECHKWFSSGPNVAAYLYRHTDSSNEVGPSYGDVTNDADNTPDADREQSDAASASATNEIGPTRLAARINWPLNTVEEEEEEDEEDDDDRTHHNTRPARLSDAQWAPLVGSPDDAHQASNLANDGPKNSSSATFTRTMFWQPSPKLPRPRPWWAQPAAEVRQPTNSTNVTKDSPNQMAAMRNDKRQNDAATEATGTPSSQWDSQSIQQPANQATAPTSQPQVTAARPPLSGYKRGTIIASASTSPRRGASPTEGANGRAYSQKYNGASSSGAVSARASFPNPARTLLAYLTKLSQMDGFAYSSLAFGGQLTSLVIDTATNNPTPPIMMFFTLLLFYSSFQTNHILTIYSP